MWALLVYYAWGKQVCREFYAQPHSCYYYRWHELHLSKFFLFYYYQCAGMYTPCLLSYPLPPRKKKKKKRKIPLQCIIVHWAFYFVLNTMRYCWTHMKGIGTLTLPLICILLVIKDWIIYFMHCLLLLKYATTSKVHV